MFLMTKITRTIAAALAIAIGAALTAPAFAAEPAPSDGRTIEQGQPKTKAETAKAAKKRAHDSQTAAKPKAGKPKTDRTPARKPGLSL
jgi:hypothetical protein